MKKNSKKAYKKALDFYEKGQIHKALKICDDEISDNINNSAIINLKGLILYIKGNLNEAKQVWKLNAEVNNDSISQKYLASISRDDEKEKLYLKALKLSNENKVRLAVDDLKLCLESDFNTLDVNNLYANCAIKLAEYDKAKLAIEKVLSIDKNNKEAIYLKKSLVKLDVIKNGSSKTVLKVSLISVLTLALVIGMVKTIPLIKNKDLLSRKESINEQVIIQEYKIPKQEEVTESNNKPASEKESDNKSFNREEVLKKIEDRDYKFINNIINEYDVNKLSVNEKVAYNSAIDFMKEHGVDLFYKEATEKIKDESFVEGDELLSIAEKYSDNSYLMEHIIYFRGNCNEKIGNIEESLKFYKNYINKYTKGEYKGEVLYRLVVNYEKIDKEVAKKYAEELNDNFPDSMYNNSVIKNIIN